ncbi:MAG TPA: tetratricopeptide repeat protein [Pyrinomonadaceae bacterium]|nr:tetratricopeptide repeat protein [Pyrinomonadaceae bacterium]
MLRRIALTCAALAALLFIQPVIFGPSRVAAQTAPARDVVMILPFENTSSNLPEYNWVGESFANSLADLLKVPGLVVLTNDERELAYQRLGLPLTTIPSLATAIRLARAANATMIVLGTYSVATAGEDKTAAALLGTARVIKVNEGRLMGEVMPDGRWASRVFDFADPLTQLQRMQGRLAFDILYARDKAFPFTRNELIERATKVPQVAFETYLKGVQTDHKEKRVNYLKNALKIYSDEKGGAVYPEAAFELGQFYFQEQDWKQAAEYFSRLQKEDPHYTEAAFHAALAYDRLGNQRAALDALMPLTPENSKTPLTSVVNNAGALSLKAAREEKETKERDELLAQGTRFLKRAADSSSADDSVVRFNYAYALFLAGKYAEAAEQLRPIIAADPKDGQSYFLLAKALEKMGQEEQAAAADNQARLFLVSAYAKWQVEWQKSQTTSNVALRLKQFNPGDRPSSASGDGIEMVPTSGSPQEFLAQAQKLYQDGHDEEALQLLRRVLTLEPTSADAFLLIGRINQRLGDQQAAISALKTAIFWESRTIDAHILLGRIFLELGDRAQALSYARSAIQIDPNNQEAIALQRQVETGSK